MGQRVGVDLGKDPLDVVPVRVCYPNPYYRNP